MKNIFVLGDSYSTFTGAIPEGNACHYREDNADLFGIDSADKLWWSLAAKEVGGKVLLNESFSGSCVCYTTYGAVKDEKNSFIGRFERAVNAGFFEKNKIDEIWFLGGTNDSWSDAPLGDLKYSDIKEEDLYEVFPAFCRLAQRMKEVCPNAKIVNIINCELKIKLMDASEIVGEHYGFTNVILHDIEKVNGHPTAKGMEEIKNQLVAVIGK